MLHVYVHQIFSDSDVQFLNGRHFGKFLCFVMLPIHMIIEAQIAYTYVSYLHADLFSEYF